MALFELDPDLPEALRPLAWLIGRWEGAGVVGYPTIESHHFGQEILCSHDGRGFLRWESRTWLLDEAGQRLRPSATELGFWRPQPNGTDVELLLTHPTGIVELYVGEMSPAKIELRTDGVMRTATSKEYSAASRLYGLVNSNLMWVMDMAAVGQPLTSHVSAELKRVGTVDDLAGFRGGQAQEAEMASGFAGESLAQASTQERRDIGAAEDDRPSQH